MQKEMVLTQLIEAFGLDENCVKLLEANEELNLQEITAIEQAYLLISKIGQLLGVPDKAELLNEELEERINIIIHKLKFIEENQRPLVAVVGNDGKAIMEENKYLQTLIRTAGGRVFDREKNSEEPSLVIFLADGKSMYQLLGELPVILASPVWAESTAVKENKIFLVEGTNHLRGNLLQVADDIELFAEIFYPQYFVFGGGGELWMKFELE